MKNRKKNTKLVLILLLVCITLGYAALRTGLNINGTTNVSSASWNVHFENYQMSNATNITPTTEPVITGTTTTSISYEVDLDVPGDIYEFSVEVVNGGSIDALISLVSKYNGSEIGPGNTIPEYIEYTVTDGNGDEIVDGHRLNHGNRETVKVFVKYKEDASVLPSQDATLRFDIEIEATQAPKAQPANNIVYVVNNYGASTSYSMLLNELIPVAVTTRTTPAEAMADWLDISGYESPFFLKFMTSGGGTKWLLCNDTTDECREGYSDTEEECLDDAQYEEHATCLSKQTRVVDEAYVGFVIDAASKAYWKSEYCSPEIAEGTGIPVEVCENQIDNFVNGTYYLRGGIDELNEENKTIFNSNKNVLRTAFNYAVQPDICMVGENDNYICGFNIDSHSGETEFFAFENGNVGAYVYSGGNNCMIINNSAECGPGFGSHIY